MGTIYQMPAKANPLLVQYINSLLAKGEKDAFEIVRQTNELLGRAIDDATLDYILMRTE